MKQEDKGLTRRDFLKGSAATAAAIGFTNFGVFTEARGETIGPDDVINAAIIGPGSHGATLLSKGMKVPNVKWVAVCDIQEKNLKRGLDIAKGAQGYADYREVLDRKDIQAVYIAVPIGMHAQISIDAMRSGKHVLCEKMMAYSIDEARQMYRVSRQTGKKLQIGYQRRYHPDYQHAYKMVKEGILGKITHVRAVWNRNGSWRRACPDPSLEELINWRLYWKCSQGLMAELGSHQIDVVNWMLGESPSSVVGVGGLDYYKDGRDIFDSVQCIYEYPSGIKFQYQSICTNEYEGCHEQIMGTEGTLVLGGKCLLYRERKAEKIAWAAAAHTEKTGNREAIVLDASKTPKAWADQQKDGTEITAESNMKRDSYLLELEDFFLSIRDGHEPLCGRQEALNTCVAAITANESMKKQQRMVIPAELYKV